MRHTEAPKLSRLIEGYRIIGEAGRTLGCGEVMLFARAFGDLLAPGDGTFAIGYDVRDSSSSLAEAASMGLRSGGHHVTHIGACTTPQLEWYIADAGLHGGLMITGGCAPTECNGMRFYGASAEPLAATRALEAITTLDLNELLGDGCNPVLRRDHALSGYAAFLRQRLHPQRLFKLCLDAGNGLTGVEFESVMAHYSQLRLWRIGFKSDPSFPNRGPDPFSKAALSGVAQCVRANGCHLGAALDADGDRLAVIDERGRAIPADTLGAVLALGLCEQRPHRIRLLHDPRIRPQVVQALDRAGVETRPLDGGIDAAHVGLHAGSADFYFDHLGHYAFRDWPGTSNGLLALIELINGLTATETPLSALAEAVDPVATSA